jgi:hypothetical protein
VSSSTRTRWIAVVALASLYVLYVPVGLAVAASGVARVLGWEGLQR